MKIAIMQPYLFPYIGYFQLINAVDYFVIYDDVQFIKGGWINRNRVLLNNKAHLFSFSVKQDSLQACINDRVYSHKVSTEINKFFKTLQAGYKKAPYYNETIELVTKIFGSTNLNVAAFNAQQLKIIANHLGIGTKFLFSSEIENVNGLKGKERVIEICKNLGSKYYVNAIGGQELYNTTDFEQEGITLSFLKTGHISYDQFDDRFVSNLSILDVLMFNSNEQMTGILNEYELI